MISVTQRESVLFITSGVTKQATDSYFLLVATAQPLTEGFKYVSTTTDFVNLLGVEKAEKVWNRPAIGVLC